PARRHPGAGGARRHGGRAPDAPARHARPRGRVRPAAGGAQRPHRPHRALQADLRGRGGRGREPAAQAGRGARRADRPRRAREVRLPRGHRDRPQAQAHLRRARLRRDPPAPDPRGPAIAGGAAPRGYFRSINRGNGSGFPGPLPCLSRPDHPIEEPPAMSDSGGHWIPPDKPAVTLESSPLEEMSKNERIKVESRGLFFASDGTSRHAFAAEIDELERGERETVGAEARELSKFYGIYKQQERGERGRKTGDHIFMARIKNPAGGELTTAQWVALDDA